jgi:hypothetical protein
MQEIVSFLHSQLSQANLPRDDYLEFLKLCLVILDEKEPGKDRVQFSPPGAYHRARWMAKGIYCLKIYRFREHMTNTEGASSHEAHCFVHCHNIRQSMVHCS